MSVLLACIKKELRLLRQDLHGLFLLFAMPTTFILIMSLAMQGEFAARSGKKLDILLSDLDHSAQSLALTKSLSDGGAFAITASTITDVTQLKKILKSGDAAFAVIIPHDFGAAVGSDTSSDDAAAKATLTALIAPDTSKQTEMIFLATLREAQGKLRLSEMLKASPIQVEASEITGPAPQVLHGYADTDVAPTAVQQNVPAWLVFAIFFVVIPLSNAMIRERQQGTLRRLRSTNVSPFTLLASKWLTFFCVNQLQVLAMLLIGAYVLPLFGGDALSLSGSKGALFVIGAAVSSAALGYALLIAVLAKTTEQATLMGGAGNIILGAIGGIMVPKFVMPSTMQTLANCSPMAWGLEGFLNVLLRGGGVLEVLPQAALLTAFGSIAFIAAGVLQQKRQMA